MNSYIVGDNSLPGDKCSWSAPNFLQWKKVPFRNQKWKQISFNLRSVANIWGQPCNTWWTISGRSRLKKAGSTAWEDYTISLCLSRLQDSNQSYIFLALYVYRLIYYESFTFAVFWLDGPVRTILRSENCCNFAPRF